MFDKIDESDLFLSVFTPNYSDDVSCLAQLGYAILKGKPIYLVAPNTQLLKGPLVDIAEAIEYYDPSDPANLEQAVERLLRRKK